MKSKQSKLNSLQLSDRTSDKTQNGGRTPLDGGGLVPKTIQEIFRFHETMTKLGSAGGEQLLAWMLNLRQKALPPNCYGTVQPSQREEFVVTFQAFSTFSNLVCSSGILW